MQEEKMSGTGSLANKNKLASLSLLQLSEGVSESGEIAFQIVVSPSNAAYPKRTLTVGVSDANLFCAELEAVVSLLRAAISRNS